MGFNLGFKELNNAVSPAYIMKQQRRWEGEMNNGVGKFEYLTGDNSDLSKATIVLRPNISHCIAFLKSTVTFHTVHMTYIL